MGQPRLLPFVGAVIMAALPVGAAESQPTRKGTVSAHVRLTVTASRPSDETVSLAVTLAIDEGCVLYANPVGLEELLAGVETRVEVTARGKPAQAAVRYPAGTVIRDETLGEYRVYRGRVTVYADVRLPAGDRTPLEVTIHMHGYLIPPTT